MEFLHAWYKSYVITYTSMFYVVLLGRSNSFFYITCICVWHKLLDRKQRLSQSKNAQKIPITYIRIFFRHLGGTRRIAWHQAMSGSDKPRQKPTRTSILTRGHVYGFRGLSGRWTPQKWPLATAQAEVRALALVENLALLLLHGSCRSHTYVCFSWCGKKMLEKSTFDL